uniref:Birch protein n=1 Tax=Betula platyphylla TaxID=78630 RepID=A0A9E9NR39_BETPL|nr:birch protein [Betula platyphylla]
MEKVAKVLLILTMLLLVFSLDVEGGRQLKISKEQIDRPQTFFGNGGTGGVRGFIPSPGLAGGIGSGPGPSSFCAIFPAGCSPILPTFPGVPIGVGSPP